MGKRPTVRSMIGLSPKEEMQIIVGHLNADLFILQRSSSADLDAGAFLKDWIKRWQDSGPNMGRFVRDNPELWKALQRHGRENPPHVYAPSDGDGVVLAWPLPSVVTSRRPPVRTDRHSHAVTELSAALKPWGRGGRVGPISRSQAKSASPNAEAVYLFLSFLTNPMRRQLGGPCARCGRYFVRRTERNPKVYCSRVCGWRATGRATIEAKRRQARQRKIGRARVLAQEWSTARSNLDWKKWVSLKEPEISPSFLTRSINRGELTVPTRNSLKEK